MNRKIVGSIVLLLGTLTILFGLAAAWFGVNIFLEATFFGDGFSSYTLPIVWLPFVACIVSFIVGIKIIRISLRFLRLKNPYPTLSTYERLIIFLPIVAFGLYLVRDQIRLTSELIRIQLF
jgi:hypothetical protein